jgi:hypothetical protein
MLHTPIGTLQQIDTQRRARLAGEVVLVREEGWELLERVALFLFPFSLVQAR